MQDLNTLQNFAVFYSHPRGSGGGGGVLVYTLHYTSFIVKGHCIFISISLTEFTHWWDLNTSELVCWFPIILLTDILSAES